MISSLQSEDDDGDGRETDTASCPQAGAYLVLVRGGRHLLPGHLSPGHLPHQKYHRGHEHPGYG